MKTFKAYQYQRFYDDEKNLLNGSFVNTTDDDDPEQIMAHFRDGYLDDGYIEKYEEVIPALQCGSHYEHWKRGVLHCDGEPAVVDQEDDYQEWWTNGKKIKREKLGGGEE